MKCQYRVEHNGSVYCIKKEFVESRKDREIWLATRLLEPIPAIPLTDSENESCRLLSHYYDK